VPILVACIGGPVMWFLTRFDKRNGENQRVLNRIEDKIEKIDGRIDDHITWHAHDK